MIFIVLYIKLLAVESFPDIINTQVDFSMFHVTCDMKSVGNIWQYYILKIQISWQDSILFMDCVLPMSLKFYRTVILWIALLGFIFKIP